MNSKHKDKTYIADKYEKSPSDNMIMRHIKWNKKTKETNNKDSDKQQDKQVKVIRMTQIQILQQQRIADGNNKNTRMILTQLKDNNEKMKEVDEAKKIKESNKQMSYNTR